MSDKKPKENPLKRILLVFSMVAFLGSTGYGLFGLYSNAFQQPQTTASSEEASVDQHFTNHHCWSMLNSIGSRSNCE